MKSLPRPLLQLAVWMLALSLTVVGAYGAVPPMGDASSSSGEAGTIIALPTTPPEVDDTPIQPQPEPELEPPTSPQSATGEQNAPAANSRPTPAEAEASLGIDNILTTETVLLLGLVVWYAFTLAGIAGGRRGRRSHPAHPSI